MDDIERFIEIAQQKRLRNQQILKLLDNEPDEHKKIMKELHQLRSMYLYFYCLIIHCNNQNYFSDVYSVTIMYSLMNCLQETRCNARKILQSISI